MDNAIIEAAQALTGLLRRAEEGGLPMPSSAEVSKYAPNQHPAWDHAGTRDFGGIEVHLLEDLPGLTEWATWLDEPIGTNDPHAGRVTHRVFGMAGPVPVKVWTRTPVPLEAVLS